LPRRRRRRRRRRKSDESSRARGHPQPHSNISEAPLVILSDHMNPLHYTLAPPLTYL